MDSTRKREHERQFPLRKIESLIKLAVDNRLSLLQIGDVKIVPGETIPEYKPLSILEEAQRRQGRPLTKSEIEDEVLFGPGGAIKGEDELE